MSTEEVHMQEVAEDNKMTEKLEATTEDEPNTSITNPLTENDPTSTDDPAASPPKKKKENEPEQLTELAEILSSLSTRSSGETSATPTAVKPKPVRQQRKRKRTGKSGAEEVPADGSATSSTATSTSLKSEPHAPETDLNRSQQQAAIIVSGVISPGGDRPGTAGGTTAGNRKKKRRMTSPEELDILNKVFEQDGILWPTRQQRMELSRKLNMSPRQIQVWFQNRRQKLRRGS